MATWRDNKWIRLVWLKGRFALAGMAATVVDYTIYLSIVDRLFEPAASNVISYSCGAGINFLLHRWFVFRLQRPPMKALALSLLVSIGGLLFSTGIVHGLSQLVFFDARQYLTKAMATGIVFFYNFYLKRFAFERRFWG